MGINITYLPTQIVYIQMYKNSNCTLRKKNGQRSISHVGYYTVMDIGILNLKITINH